MKLFPDRPIGRLAYLKWVLPLLALHGMGRFLLLESTGSAPTGLSLLPFVTGAEFLARQHSEALLALLLLGLVFTWLLTMISLRRAAETDLGPGMAAMCLIPLLQMVGILCLCLMPGREPAQAGAPGPEASPDESRQQEIATSRWRQIAEASFAGIALSMVTMLIGVMLLGDYEYGVFILTPFFVGISGGYLVNRRQEMSTRYTISVVMMATVFSSLALMAFAMEGLICVILASPLVALVAAFGSAIGQGLASFAPRRRSNVASGFVILPLFLAASPGTDKPAVIELQTTIEIAAPPRAVWDALVQMERIEERPGLPFRMGIAYPLSGVTYGEGVGAIRHGNFSTGVAVESVTEWEPDRVMAFKVLSDTPSMRELSLYEHVHAPHLHGYFKTEGGRFTMEAVGCNRTRLTEHTRHSLRIGPVEYWLPFARWVVRENHGRVLRHLTRKAEAAATAAAVAETGC